MNIIEYKLIESYNNKFNLTPKKLLNKKNIKFTNYDIKRRLPKLNFNSVSTNNLVTKKIVMFTNESKSPNYLTRDINLTNNQELIKKNFQTIENKK